MNLKYEVENENMINHKIGWKELKKFHKNPPKISLPKGIDNYNKYNLHLEMVKKTFGNINDYLFKKLFKSNNFFTILDADFPYLVSEYIQHKIIWFNPIFFNDIIIDYDIEIGRAHV